MMSWGSSGPPLQGKVAVVTGSSRGIGRAIARRLARDGALVVVNYVANADAASEVVSGIEASGGEAFAVGADVSSKAGIHALFATCDAELRARRGDNGIDILVNNAGAGRFGGPADTTEEIFDLVFAADVKGPFFVTQAAIPRLRDGGRVITISSGRSKRPTASTAAYCMAKAAVDTHIVMLAAELGERRITANVLAPGWTVTDQSEEFLGDDTNQREIAAATALRRLGQPDDIAAVAAFLASDDGRWVTGQYVEASGGFDLVAIR
ncbi:3-oxoacyl-[acyl-carrier protein] reductase [Mycobacterium sp. URHB0021]